VTDSKAQVVEFVTKDCPHGKVVIHGSKKTLVVSLLQGYLDEVMPQLERGGAKIDYIHGEETVREKAAQDCALGLLLPAMAKKDLFRTVIIDGVLPRKTFSMGEADEKRYYLEARMII
jgi:hypothetical protein